MKRCLCLGLAVLFLSTALGAAATKPALRSPAATATLTVDATTIAAIVAVPAGKAILDKDIPGLTTHPAYQDFKSLSLTELQPASEGAITDAQIEAVRADLAKISGQAGPQMPDPAAR